MKSSTINKTKDFQVALILVNFDEKWVKSVEVRWKYFGIIPIRFEFS